jgi:hypothetical protein
MSRVMPRYLRIGPPWPQFIDEMTRLGGRLHDLMAATDYGEAARRRSEPRRRRVAPSAGTWSPGLGASGSAYVTHDGVFDRAAKVETEELWFPIWEFAGMPWNNFDLYAKWSPTSS